MNILDRVKNCNGCAACMQVCPQSCITMKEDYEGFLYPKVDRKTCLECGKCLAVCPILNVREKNPNIKAYAAVSEDRSILLSSSSGGAFTVIADAVIGRGGVVYGAAYTDDYQKVEHRRVSGKDGLIALQGSKYLQSSIAGVYVQVEADLNDGLWVLFSGTPCQIIGLLEFMKKHDPHLLTQDIVCHGVPSPTVWRSYLQFRKYGKTVVQVNMRDKSSGWKRFSMKIEYAGGKQYKADFAHDLYLRGFLQNLFLRPSCYNCAFKSEQRVSDLTLGDFWGYSETEIADRDTGISLIGVNTEKGARLLSDVRGLKLSEVIWKKAIASNSAATQSVPMNEKRYEFFERLRKTSDFASAVKPCLIEDRSSLKETCIHKLSSLKERIAKV